MTHEKNRLDIHSPYVRQHPACYEIVECVVCGRKFARKKSTGGNKRMVYKTCSSRCSRLLKKYYYRIIKRNEKEKTR